MKYTATLITLFSGAVAQISKSCVDIAFDTATDVLSAECMPRDHSGYVPTSLDLNDCFGYDGTQLTATYNGDFGASCSGCHTYIAPDPWYGTSIYWMNCTCTGQSVESSVPIEVAVAHEYVNNNDGSLQC